MVSAALATRTVEAVMAPSCSLPRITLPKSSRKNLRKTRFLDLRRSMSTSARAVAVRMSTISVLGRNTAAAGITMEPKCIPLRRTSSM